jgi:hypothetical protein
VNTYRAIEEVRYNQSVPIDVTGLDSYQTAPMLDFQENMFAWRHSAQCRTSGLGCEGWHEAGAECICECHTTHLPLETMQQVVDFHAGNR